ncbi:MAG TPA: histidine phosphatase family protein [Candidatus Limnocylindrales bacterium]|nr:histidine phosphatase family protein [Candidatus Limnocylindrales bacterium]
MVLLRHGESTWVAEGRFQGQGDPPLSEAGRRQAGLAADRLARPHHPPSLPVPIGPPLEIVHSPLARTAETAELVGAALAGKGGFGVDVPRRPDPGFLEIGQGEWEGLPAAEIQARWPEVIAGWRRDPLQAWAPGGESVRDVDARARASLGLVIGALHERAGETVGERSHVLGYGEPPSMDPWTIVIGHDGVFKVALLALLDLPLERFWSFPFALCGISVIEFRAGRPRLRAHNLTDHLAPFDDERSQAIEAERNRAGAL